MSACWRGFVGQRGDVQPAQRHVRAFAAIMIGQCIGAIGRRDIHLNHHQIGFVVEAQFLDVLVLNLDLVVGTQITGERGQAQRRKQRILDRPPERAGGFGQCGQDHFDFHVPNLARGCATCPLTRSAHRTGGQVLLGYRSGNAAQNEGLA